jgi:hypothetical protein
MVTKGDPVKPDLKKWGMLDEQAYLAAFSPKRIMMADLIFGSAFFNAVRISMSLPVWRTEVRPGIIIVPLQTEEPAII